MSEEEKEGCTGCPGEPGAVRVLRPDCDHCAENDERKETVQEHNDRTTQSIERYLKDVEQAETFLKRAEYVTFTKKEWIARKQKMQLYLILLIIFSMFTGFSICKVMG